jgi:hypothetical protein
MKTKRETLADIAEIEAKKELVWSPKSDAEKYLKTVRTTIGSPSGRFAWCGAFTYWCCLQAGYTFKPAFATGYSVAYVPGWEAWAKANKTWFSSRLPSSEFNPERGDILIFDWDSDSVPDHIGIVLAYDGKRTITTAEGNTSVASNSNGNATAVRKRDWMTVRGFIRLPKD